MHVRSTTYSVFRAQPWSTTCWLLSCLLGKASMASSEAEDLIATARSTKWCLSWTAGLRPRVCYMIHKNLPFRFFASLSESKILIEGNLITPSLIRTFWILLFWNFTSAAICNMLSTGRPIGLPNIGLSPDRIRDLSQQGRERIAAENAAKADKKACRCFLQRRI